ncbi:MAG: GNAT family N-acetyltransferase [Scytonema sp. PMC 1069.18]|nr:GNAT family N-acetyltransferase [Scytonema sp. PMC 1069.18]MEC4879786.1 GNAT family N-acetyltransferase [Scytonema sp. PMC 1070.18]
MIQVNEKILQIDDFTMRPFQISDLDALAAIWSDPVVTQFLPSRGARISRENVEKALISFIEHWNTYGYGVWAIEENLSSQMIGYCGLRYLDEMNDIEVLYGLAKDYWGRGIATKAVKAAIDFGLSKSGLRRIIALALPENRASVRVMEKAGFEYEKKIHCFGLDGICYVIHQKDITKDKS